MTYPEKIKFVTLSGPAGVGKTTLMKLFLAFRSFTTVESYTTRPKREDEKNADSKSEYVFISPNVFQELVQKDSFAWYFLFDGHYYGTLKKSLRDALDAKLISIMILTPEIISRLRENIETFGGIPQKNIVSFFLYAPEENLTERMRRRGSKEESIRNRLNLIPYQTKKARELNLIQIENSDMKTPSYVFKKMLRYISTPPQE